MYSLNISRAIEKMNKDWIVFDASIRGNEINEIRDFTFENY